MALTAVLVEATPYLLKYLLTAPTSTSLASTVSPSFAWSPAGAPPVNSTGNLVIPNRLGATPDLATDALAGSVAGGRGVHTLQSIVNARRVGYQQIAAGAAVTQAQARALLASDDPTNAVNTTRNVLSCEMFITCRRSSNTTLARTNLVAESNMNRAPTRWNVDASIDASTNPIVIVKLDRVPVIEVGQAQTAYLTIRCRHSYSW